MEREGPAKAVPRSRDDHSGVIEEKLRTDLRDLGGCVAGCRRCPGGGGGIPGYGEPGSDLFLLAGRPGPGASPENPWGSWRDDFRSRAVKEWGWSGEGIYMSTALRCPLKRVTPAELRRCAAFLAEEIFIIGPRLLVVSGKLAAVTLRAALGDEVPGKPRAGDTCKLFSTRFLFDLDIARVGKEKEAADTFWDVLHRAEELL